MEWIQGPTMKTLKEKDKLKNNYYTKTRCEEPTGMDQWIDKKYRNKDINWSRECNCIIKSHLHRSSKFKLT